MGFKVTIIEAGSDEAVVGQSPMSLARARGEFDLSGVDPELHQHTPSLTRDFPLFPAAKSQPTANSLVPLEGFVVAEPMFEVVKPSGAIEVEFPEPLAHGDTLATGGDLTDALRESVSGFIGSSHLLAADVESKERTFLQRGQLSGSLQTKFSSADPAGSNIQPDFLKTAWKSAAPGQRSSNNEPIPMEIFSGSGFFIIDCLFFKPF